MDKIELFISKDKIRKILGLNLILMVVLYGIAIILTLTGHDYFITQYNNETLQLIQDKLTEWHLIGCLSSLFVIIESTIIQFYIVQHKPKWYIILTIFISFCLMQTFLVLDSWIYTLILFGIYLLIPLFYKEYRSKKYLYCLLRLAIIIVIVFTLQYVIQIIKTSIVDNISQIDLPLSLLFIFNVEYYLALSLVVAWLTLMQEGVKEKWAVLIHGSSSQTLKKKS